MARVTYEILEHDGGWAYRVNGTYSETFPTRDAAHMAATRAAQEQRTPGETAGIAWEDESGRWHAELSHGNDRPSVEVDD